MSDPRTMAWLAPEERESLGLAPDSQMIVIGNDRDAQEQESHAQRHSSADWSHEQVLRLLKAERALIPLHLPMLEHRLPGAQLARWNRDRNITLLSSAHEGNTAIYGECTWLDKTTILLDARNRPAYVVWSSDNRGWVLRSRNGELTLFEGSPVQPAVRCSAISKQESESGMGRWQTRCRQLLQSEQKLLGVSGHVFLRLVAYMSAPSELPPVKAIPADIALWSHGELIRLLSTRRDAIRAVFKSLSLRIPGAVLEHWNHDARIAFLTWQGPTFGKTSAWISGFWRLLDEHVAMLDSRVRPVYVQGCREGLDWVLRFENGNLDLFEGGRDISGKSMNGPGEQRNGFMNGLAPAELELLGFHRGVEFEPVERKALTAEFEVADNGASPEGLDFRAEWAALAANLHERIPLGFEQVRSVLRGGSLSCSQSNSRVLFLETGDTQSEIQLSGDCSWIGNGIILLDARERPAYVHGVRDGIAWVLRFHERVLTFFVETKWSEQPDWEPPKPPEIPAPDIDSLMGRAVVEPWLVALVRQMAESPRTFKKVAAAGVLARLWSSPDRAGREQTRRWLDAGGIDPTAAAVRWFQGLGNEQQELIESLALYEWNEIEKSFEKLVEIALEDPDAANEIGRSWLHRRDDLHSVLFLLRRADAGGALTRSLEKFDKRAASHRELWALLEIRDDQRLRAVSWQDPDAWWGTLVVDSML